MKPILSVHPLRRLRTLSLLPASLALVGGLPAAEDQAAAIAEQEFNERIEPLLADYCYDCHGDGADKGDISLDEFDSVASHLENRELWLRVWENIRTGMMPPPKKRNQPSAEEREQLAAWIEGRVFKLDPDNPDPGRVTIRRMNRDEYRNTIYDLLGLRFSTDDNFPPDDTGFGFDTIGDVLTISPLLMEKYFAAAEEIAGLALPDDAGRPNPIDIDASNFRDRGRDQSARFMEADIEHTVAATRRFDAGASYELELSYSVESESGRPKGQTATWRALVDGEDYHVFQVDSDRGGRRQFKTELNLAKGERRFEFSIEPGEPGEGAGTSGIRVSRFRLQRLGGRDWDFYPESYKRILFDGLPPEGDEARAAYMREIVSRFALRAFRRPPGEAIVDRITALALAKTEEGGNEFVDGVKLAVTAILTSPRFLFRSEMQSEPDNPDSVVPLDDYALASRLSYFLWSSTPDEELLDLAKDGTLRQNLRPQVDRMIADGKIDRMVQNFVGQWLQARDLPGLQIDTRRILRERSRRVAERVFNNGIRRDMKTETEQFFRYVLVEDRPILELLNADYSFLNENLARFYKVPDVRGRDFRKVEFDAEQRGRGGLLGQGTFLIVTSQPTRTSPVKRGLFVLENVLGTPTPPAPPDVPELANSKEKLDEGATMRQLMELHRESSLCKSCHQRMDPIGLALENFNAIGQWRDEADGKPIDSAGELVTGERFSNVMELKEILASSRKDDFYRCLTEKMMTYALGRGIEYYDAPTIDSIVGQVSSGSGGMKELVYGIVESVPFQKRRGDGVR